MRQAKDNDQVPARYYRPEQLVCPRCGQTLKRCYPLWRKYVVFLDRRYWVVSLGYSCQNPKCAWRNRVYESQAARRWTVRGSSFALEVIVQIGTWRFWKRWTVAQIHERLTQERHGLISEREVLYLIEVFLVLLRCTYDLRLEEHAAYFRRHGLFVAIDALKPEKGNTAWYVVRELKFGLILHQAALRSTAHPTLATRLLQPVKPIALIERQGGSHFGDGFGVASLEAEVTSAPQAGVKKGLPKASPAVLCPQVHSLQFTRGRCIVCAMPPGPLPQRIKPSKKP